MAGQWEDDAPFCASRVAVFTCLRRCWLAALSLGPAGRAVAAPASPERLLQSDQNTSLLGNVADATAHIGIIMRWSMSRRCPPRIFKLFVRHRIYRSISKTRAELSENNLRRHAAQGITRAKD
jgi:hypothetical protein